MLQFGIPIVIASSTLGLKLWAVTVGIKTYKSIIKKKRKNHDKIVFLGKPKLNIIEVIISKVLIDSDISYNESVWVTNLLKEYNDMKEAIKNPKIINSKNI